MIIQDILQSGFPYIAPLIALFIWSLRVQTHTEKRWKR